jgi:hypothetical protein
MPVELSPKGSGKANRPTKLVGMKARTLGDFPPSEGFRPSIRGVGSRTQGFWGDDPPWKTRKATNVDVVIP